jgi:thioredoxin-like negative regulator of GroEL
MVTSCAGERPEFQPVYDRFVPLREAVPPAAPETASGDTDDEAEIQFRAAAVFYRQGRWAYAIPAFAETVDYDDDRHDARFYWAACLVLTGRDAEAQPLLEELLETRYEMDARPLLARVLFRQGRGEDARAVAGAAAKENHDAAGWVARYDLLTR